LAVKAFDGVGVYPEISLADARAKRKKQKAGSAGIDPVSNRKRKEEQAKAYTFEKVAREWHATNKNGRKIMLIACKRAWRTISSRQLVLAILLNWVPAIC
jgi:hypothetical protein